VRLAFEHADREHQEAGRAEAALQAVMVHERLLHRMQVIALRQPLDGADLFAVSLHGEHQARAHRRAVDDDGAGAADAVLAADMRAGLAAVLADRVDERAPRLDGDFVRAAVDGQGDGGFVGHSEPLDRSSPRKRGPSAKHFGPSLWLWVPACAGTNGACRALMRLAPWRAAPRGRAAASPASRR